MLIIPVIDLLGGVVVRGVGGRRDEYRPIVSQIAADARPATVGDALVNRGFRTAYVADLDAIAGAEPVTDVYSQLIDCGLQLWVDAGIRDVERARRLAAFARHETQIEGIIAGLESVDSPQLLGELLDVVGHNRLIFSLDLKRGEPLTTSVVWRAMSAQQIAATAIQLGVRRLIVLDLARVGEGQGVGTEDICREIHALDENVALIAGGGVRDQRDLESLAQAGCEAALVASALHDGRLVVKRTSSVPQ
jgi:phosphoribosylformimino-5-aminoimidazole carboxamide ribotide isomerase